MKEFEPELRLVEVEKTKTNDDKIRELKEILQKADLVLQKIKERKNK